ncbi:hypothetical protein B0T10DRAFT_490369 [Thelonectria olida]|uniref:Rhodopsin domain-containing protein n=1 Tax=Thelonectria olida TaxID=1576542 RepID=A0A9P8W0B8_9HYPO|nr:hypothetical protein B0T10DRAFT_490369 [Thelonectria olida]
MGKQIENRGPQLLGVNVFFLVVSLISISLRCYSRIGLVKAFGLDDWLMVVAAVFFTLYNSFSSSGVRYGTGRHSDDLEDEDAKKAMMCWWFCYIFYCLSMIASKLSIGVFLLRITVNKIHTWIIYAAMFCTVVSGICFFFVTMFQCSPIPYFWDKDLPGHCIPIKVVIALAFIYSSFSVISDFIFAVLPGVIVWNLQMHRRAKLALLPLLVMGCVASSAVLARFPYLHKLGDPDFLWNTLDVAIWSTVEQGLAITAGSLATLRPLVARLGLRWGLTSKSSGLRSTGYGTSSRLGLGLRNEPNTEGGAHHGYSLSAAGRDGVGESQPVRYELKSIPDENDRSYGRGNSKFKTKAAIVDNESEEELHSPATWK